MISKNQEWSCREDLERALRIVERRHLIYGDAGELLVTLRQFLDSPPVMASSVVRAICSSVHISEFASTALEYAALIDSHYVAVDCHALFTSDWSDLTDSIVLDDRDVLRWQNVRIGLIGEFPLLANDLDRVRFLSDSLSASVDPYLRGRAAFFLINEYGEQSKEAIALCPAPVADTASMLFYEDDFDEVSPDSEDVDRSEWDYFFDDSDD